MAAKSVIVIDGLLSDSILEYSAIVDSFNQSNEFSSLIESTIKFEEAEESDESDEENFQITDEDLLVDSLIKSIEVLNKANERDYEPTFNLLIYILRLIDANSFESNLSKLIDLIYNLIIPEQAGASTAIKDKFSLKVTSIISIFSNLFNLVNETSPLKTELLSNIISLASLLKEFSYIKPIGTKLIDWLLVANTPIDQTKKLFWTFLNLDKEHSYDSLLLLKAYTDKLPVEEADLAQILAFALNSSTIDLSFLATPGFTKALSGSAELSTIYKTYINGALQQFKTLDLAKYNLNAEIVSEKVKILSLARFLKDKSTISYTEIANELAITEESVESVLIEAIANKIISGKLNQVDNTFIVYKVNLVGDIDHVSEWKSLSNILINWKQNLNDIREVVELTKEKNFEKLGGISS